MSMMNFINRLQSRMLEEGNVSVTENGAVGYRTTGKALVDMNFAVSSMRSMEEEQIINRFIKAFYEDKRLAVKWLFFASDVRGGMGERRLFRILMHYLAQSHTEIAEAVLQLIPEYSRWDNLWCLLDTSLEGQVITLVKAQLEEDIANMQENRPVSLLAKWMPSVNASGRETRAWAQQLRQGLGMNNAEYRKLLSRLRAYLQVVEVDMSKAEWGNIDYERVPSRANLIYRNAFYRHDEERRRAYLESLQKGEATIHSGVLFPQDIVRGYYEGIGWNSHLKSDADITLEELWKGLPDYVQGDAKTLCVVDGSGSMRTSVGNTMVRCLDVANALAIYFSERCCAQLQNKYITFSMHPQLVDLSKAKNLREKLEISAAYHEVANTNVEAVFDLLLQTAVAGRMKQEELPENILVLSDMEFDGCMVEANGSRIQSKRLFTEIAQKYARYGYKLPRLVFWNIASRTGTIPMRENELGVALVSGFSPTVMKMVLSGSMDSYTCLVETLGDSRYDAVEAALENVI